ncbi:MAG: hypothetical protein NTX50_25690 [Candidatus Sumerlaeota bacterium]|nr:hypothetical protein [Candidatus Sumerlaeota bacterium]
MINENKTHIGLGLGVAAFVFVLFAPALWRGEIPYFMDILAAFYPARFHAAQLLHEAQLPFWNRSYYLGTPLLANPQWGLLYPGNWPFLLWPCGSTFLFSYPLHIAIAALGCYRLAWELSRNRAAALTAAAFSVCNGWTWAHLAFGAFFNVTAWIPWTVWIIIRFARTRKKSLIAWGAILWALQLLGGAPQMAWYAALNYGLLGFLLIFRSPGGDDSFPSNSAISAPSFLDRMLRGRIGPLLAVLIIGVLGAGLAAPQLMPTAFFVQECERAGGLNWGEVEVGTLGLKDLYHSLFGGTGFPEDAETTAYFGFTGVALILLSLFAAAKALKARRASPPIPASAGDSATEIYTEDELSNAAVASKPSQVCAKTTLALWILLAADLLFCNRLVGRLLYSFFPLYDNFHDPKRILGAAQAWMSVLAGIGIIPLISLLQYTRSWGERRTTANTWTTLYFLAIYVPILFIPCLNSLLCEWPPNLLNFLGWHCPIDGFYLFRWIYGGLALVIALEFSVCAFNKLHPISSSRATLLIIIGLLFALSCVPFSMTRIDCKTISTVADWAEPPEALMSILKSSANPRFISLDGTGQYSYNYTSADFGALALPQMSCLHGIEDAQGYDPFIPRPYGQWLNEVNDTKKRFWGRHFGLVYADAAFTKRPAPWSAIVCQKTLIAKLQKKFNLSLTGVITNATSDGRIVIYQPPDVMPYCRLVRQDGSEGAAPAIIKRGANSLMLKVSPCAVAQRLEIEDTLMPGWTARIEGAAAPFDPGPLMTLMVPAGAADQIVDLNYWPPGLNLGLGMAAICLAALIVLLRLLQCQTSSVTNKACQTQAPQ